jgi:hypothetical protein
MGRSTVNAKKTCLTRYEKSSTKREARLSQDRNRHPIQRAKESSTKTHCNTEQNEQPNNHRSVRVTNSWVNKEKSAINYDPSIPYKDDYIVSIGDISAVYKHCLASKFKDESKGMYCLRGKVKLEEIIRNQNSSCAIYTAIITHLKLPISKISKLLMFYALYKV